MRLFCWHKWKKGVENLYNSNVTTINYYCVKCGKTKHSVVPAKYSNGGFTVQSGKNSKGKGVVTSFSFSDADNSFKVQKYKKKKK